ncbi:PRCC [Mytilus coruscus]|uniref:PRCC n=1 Tax=Mytilus coruscus TaxID=42192 RepID=A0A6J8F3L5_MYTCO|nr:PRCC [Mytilus coruscus]
MSLVAYYTSSDNDSEDETGVQHHENSTNGNETNHSVGSVGQTTTNISLEKTMKSENEKPHQTKKIQSLIHEVDDSVNSLLKNLPAPKTVMQSDGKQDDYLEDAVKPKPSQIADAPKPPSKTRKPVKISIPTIDSDSDDENEPRKKKQKIVPQTGKTGLTAILPPPIHSSRKESNRTLLPYVFTKKKQTDSKPVINSTNNSVKSTSVTKPGPTSVTSKTLNIATYGSESEDSENEDDSSNFFALGSVEQTVKPAESSNFFSLDSEVQPSKGEKSSNFFSLDTQIQPIRSGESSMHSTLPKINLNLPPPIKSVKTKVTVETDHSDLLAQHTSLKRGVIGTDSSIVENPINRDKPLNLISTMENAPLTFKSTMKNPYRNFSSFQTQENSYQPASYGTEIVGPTVCEQNEQVEGYSNADDINVLQQDEEFLRLQGKHQRGKEPIQFVDVNADDFISTAEYQKALSEETEYRPSHKKKDGPSSQQKRKHQITYLAHQAKERELELKNAWSQNAMSKRQTQAKYGF